jgi:hypothetical protein
MSRAADVERKDAESSLTLDGEKALFEGVTGDDDEARNGEPFQRFKT